MIDKIILSAVLGAVGYSGLFPDPPVPLTLQQKAKAKFADAYAEFNKLITPVVHSDTESSPPP